MSADGNGRVQFGDFELDSRSGKLLRNGQVVRIQPQPLRLLQLLIERAGETVPREVLRSHIWNGATFVEFDQGLNYCIRQIRLALNDDAASPAYVETLPKQGYRFIAGVTVSTNSAGAHSAALPLVVPVEPPPPAAIPWTRKRSGRLIAAALCAGLAIAGTVFYFSFRSHPASVEYEQLTDFTDSALAPALSPDGRMVAFIRGSESFLTPDQIYVKVLPNGEPRRLTNDKRLKYNLAFTPDGSEVAYTVFDATIPTASAWSTYTVSVLGGDPRLLLSNAAGLTWLDEHQLLFSQIRSGMNMGVVTGTVTREHFREIYFPTHQRGMAHYSYASPDRKSALVVEMDGQGRWAPCRLISLDGRPENRQVGPRATCTSAAWSPNGLWMYFAAVVEGHSHLWRQRFPNGRPEQITFGPTEEEGIAVEQDGRSVITSMGMRESAIWIHDRNGDRSLSSEGEIITGVSPPSFSADGKVLYYLLQHQSAGLAFELWRMNIESGESEAVFPGISMLAYDVSPDGKLVVYSAQVHDGKAELWLAPVDRSFPAKHIGSSGETSPHFGPDGQILFLRAEGNFNYLERMNPDGSGRSKVVSYPIAFVQAVSPFGHWVMGAALPDPNHVAELAIPTTGGPPRVLCASYCTPSWSPNGKFLFISVEAASRTSPGRSLAIPVGPGENLPELPPGGIPPLADPSVVPGSQLIGRARLVPGIDPSHFAYVNSTVHRNLYRVPIP